MRNDILQKLDMYFPLQCPPFSSFSITIYLEFDITSNNKLAQPDYFSFELRNVDTTWTLLLMYLMDIMWGSTLIKL